MAIIYKDFNYMNHSLQEMGLICVDFESESDIPLGLQRTIQKGETNRYRIKSNHIYTSYDDPLGFEINIIKNTCINSYDQSEMKFNKNEIREVTRWLSSSTIPQLLITTDANDEVLNYCGVFTNIESFVVGGEVYGFALTFSNDSPFAYSDIITNKIQLNDITSSVLLNNSDLLDDYIYPVMHIKPKSNTDFYMVNTDDSTILDTGKIVISGDSNLSLNNFLTAIEDFARLKGYTIEYYYDSDGYIKSWANNTALRIKLIEKDGAEHYCFAYYESNGSYKIIEGGFITLKLYSDLNIDINCELLTIQDSIGRMVHFKNVGLEDEDYIYWLRLISGYNTLLFYGVDCTVEIEYRELLKVGAV